MKNTGHVNIRVFNHNTGISKPNTRIEDINITYLTVIINKKIKKIVFVFRVNVEY